MLILNTADRGSDGLSALSVTPNLHLYRGIAVSLLYDTVSVCTMSCGVSGDPVVDPEMTWKRPLEEQGSLLQAVADARKLFRAQKESFTESANTFTIPLILAVPHSSPQLEARLQSLGLPERRSDRTEDYLKSTVLKLFGYAAKSAEYPAEGIKPYFSRFEDAGFSKREIETWAMNPPKTSLVAKIELHGRRMEQAEREGNEEMRTSAFRRLKRLAVIDIRQDLKSDRRSANPVYSHYGNENAHFVKYVWPQFRYFDHPEIRAAVRKEFLRQGYKGAVVIEYPDSPAMPYFSSLLAVQLVRQRDRTLQRQ